MLNRLGEIFVKLLLAALAALAPVFLWRELSLRIREVRAQAWVDHVSSSLRGRTLSYGVSFWYPWPQTHDTRTFGTSLARDSSIFDKDRLKSRSVWFQPALPESIRTDDPGSLNWVHTMAVEVFPADDVRQSQAMRFQEAQRRFEANQQMSLRERLRQDQSESSLPLAMASYAYAWPLPPDAKWYEESETMEDSPPIGRIECWVDPAKPSGARLQREPVWIWGIGTLVLSLPAAFFLGVSALQGIRRLFGK